MSINFLINNQPNINNSNLSRNNKIISKNKLSADTISFKSTHINNSAKLLDDTITQIINSNHISPLAKMKFHKILNKTLPDIVTPQNFINNGRESKVYQISDNYVIKVKRGTNISSMVHFFNHTTFPNSKFRNLDFYYGEPIIKLGKTEILKNATPTKDSFCCGVGFNHAFVPLEEIEKYEKNTIPKIATLPQESYDNFAQNLKNLNKFKTNNFLYKDYYTPDIMNPNNIIVSGNKFKLVDKLDKIPYENPNSIYTMLEPLLIRLNPDKIATYNPEIVTDRRNILQKTLIAGEKAKLPLGSIQAYASADYVLDQITKRVKNKNDITPVEIIDKLKELRYQDASTNERINFIKETMK